MRTNVTDRLYRVFTYQSVDRVPDIEFGYWPQTIRRWLREGMPIELTKEEQNQMFLAKLDEFFGFDSGEIDGPDLHLGMHPCFEEEVLERRKDSVLMRAADGSIAERFLNDSEESLHSPLYRFSGENAGGLGGDEGALSLRRSDPRHSAGGDCARAAVGA